MSVSREEAKRKLVILLQPKGALGDERTKVEYTYEQLGKLLGYSRESIKTFVAELKEEGLVHPDLELRTDDSFYPVSVNFSINQVAGLLGALTLAYYFEDLRDIERPQCLSKEWIKNAALMLYKDIFPKDEEGKYLKSYGMDRYQKVILEKLANDPRFVKKANDFIKFLESEADGFDNKGFKNHEAKSAPLGSSLDTIISVIINGIKETSDNKRGFIIICEDKLCGTVVYNNVILDGFPENILTVILPISKSIKKLDVNTIIAIAPVD